MAESDNDSSTAKKIVTVIMILILIAVVGVIIFLIINNHQSGDKEYSHIEKINGVKCENVTLTHPVFVYDETHSMPLSHTNTVVASFNENGLSNISYSYTGVYENADIARTAWYQADANYNIILADEYNIPIDVYNHKFTQDDVNVYLTVTASGDGLNTIIPSYFLLDDYSTVPSSAKTMAATFEARGFTCETND